MILNPISHYLILPLFLLGSFFSCPAFADMVTTTHSMNHETSEEKEHDCCPKDGHHTTDIDSKTSTYSFAKDDIQGDIGASMKRGFHLDEYNQIQGNNIFTEAHHIDKQHLFFIETIRLLL